ncbi:MULTISPECIES: YceI family protein [Arthrobacter]|jgi:polyisoprenoid-binding protein YceI|uniref:YceI family protein n=1 Tax=Arthrobacter TaxID=1663 RepID=UPI001AAE30AF|nr:MULTISPECIES: YceI family protein [Arthrobacter]QTF72508.1 YceI family protein [Arthrobacter woluwensis]WFR83592.1 YceI family protein [Arthrobacter sp. Y-9]
MSIPTNLTAGTWTLDPSHSEAAWTVRHAGISKVRGTFGDLAATVTVTDNDAVVDATIQSASISTGDANRDGHVKGEDFFDVENHPTLTFKSTSLEGDGEDYKLNGELTIKGVSVPVTFDAEFGGVAVDPFGNTRAGVSAETTISRKEFGLTWNAALEAGGVLVSDKVKINLELSFLAPSAS